MLRTLGVIFPDDFSFAGLRSSRCSSEIDRLRQQLATPIIDKDSTANETCACQAELVLSGKISH